MRPSQGGRTKTAMMGGIMALLLALGYAFSRVFFDDTIIDQADVEALRLIPVLGVLPKVRGAPVKKAAVQPKESPGAV
jgi:capsular polysaccharide biosynthesis protein